MDQGQDNATVKQLHAIAEDETLSCVRLRAILKGLAGSFYHASYGDLVCKEQEVAVLLAKSASSDIIHSGDRLIRMS